jgi:hypothetical protein
MHLQVRQKAMILFPVRREADAAMEKDLEVRPDLMEIFFSGSL